MFQWIVIPPNYISGSSKALFLFNFCSSKHILTGYLFFHVLYRPTNSTLGCNDKMRFGFDIFRAFALCFFDFYFIVAIICT
jgi:hypothetical protein